MILLKSWSSMVAFCGIAQTEREKRANRKKAQNMALNAEEGELILWNWA